MWTESQCEFNASIIGRLKLLGKIDYILIANPRKTKKRSRSLDSSPTARVINSASAGLSEYPRSEAIFLRYNQLHVAWAHRPRDIMKLTRSVIPYTYCNLQRLIIGIF